ncbi:hypothetical protein BYT27DRAFT_7091886 [Phlegmacium glaucopus]|nr:hypothetical protein BYT27DRAFT_7091886 [Phlegmacium glaucopus]
MLLLQANGLIEHILDPSEALDPSQLDCIPALLPILPVSPTPADLTALTHWWDDDNATQHILTS